MASIIEEDNTMVLVEITKEFSSMGSPKGTYLSIADKSEVGEDKYFSADQVIDADTAEVKTAENAYVNNSDAQSQIDFVLGRSINPHP